jgi:hypothetical protein
MRYSLIGIRGALLIAALPAIMPVDAAEVYVQPTATLTAETDSNLDMTPGGQPQVQGYLGSAAALVGIVTPDSGTTIKPRLEYRDYPGDAANDRLEEYLDLNSFYKSARTNASIGGTYDHRDEFNAELTPALYDEVNPNQPTQPQTGRTVTGATRDSIILTPSYLYKLAPLWGVGASAIYQKINYSPNDAFRYVDFYYNLEKLFAVWTLTQSSDLNIGPYTSKYEATRYDSNATSNGVSVQLNTSWTQLLSTSASVTYQRSKIEYEIPPVFNSTVGAWGALFSANYKTQTTQFRTDLGRLITPSGGGSIYFSDYVQFQVDRSLSSRLNLTAAAIAQRSGALTANAGGNDRDYLRTVIDLKWMLARTWFVQGGYSYTWQKYQLVPDGAANNRVYIRFGYQGLGRQW